MIFKNSASIVLKGTWHGEAAAFKHILERIKIDIFLFYIHKNSYKRTLVQAGVALVDLKRFIK